MKKIWRENELEEFRLLLPVSITNEVVLTSFYCNPTLHRGHLALIKGAMKYICMPYCGFNTFVVAINGEKSTKEKYGWSIPIEDRLELASMINSVDYVIEFDHDNMSELIRKLKPLYFLKGGDRNIVDGSMNDEEILAAREVGCKIVDGVGGYAKLASNSEFISQLVWDVEEKCSNRMLEFFTCKI